MKNYFLFLILVFIFFSKNISYGDNNFSKDDINILDIIKSGNKNDEIHIILEKSVLNFDIKYNNFENRISINDKKIKLSCNWFNSKNIICNIINPNRIIAGNNYLIKIYDSNLINKNSKVIFEKQINLNPIIFGGVIIEDWKTKNTPIIKVILNDFVEEEKIISHLRLKNKNNLYFLQKTPEYEKYIDKKSRDNLFNLKFNNIDWNSDETKNKYENILILKPVSFLEENTEFKIVYIDESLNIENEIFHFKTFEKKPKFLGVECSNRVGESIFIENNLGDKNYNSLNSLKCNIYNGVKLLFSSKVELDDILNNFDFNWKINKDDIKNSYFISSNSNPYKIYIPLYDAGKNYIIKRKITNINSSKNLRDIFGDIFDEKLNNKFKIEFQSLDLYPSFEYENFQNIFNFQSNELNKEIILNAINIENYKINYNIIDNNDDKNFIKEEYKNNDSLEYIKNNIGKIKINLENLFKEKSNIIFGKIIAKTTKQEQEEDSLIEKNFFAQKTNIDSIIKIYKDSITIISINLLDNSELNNASINIREIDFDDFIKNDFTKNKIIYSGKTNERGILNIKNFSFNEFEKKVFIVETKFNSEISWKFLTNPYNSFDQNSFDFYNIRDFQNIFFVGFPDSFIKQSGEKLFFKIYLKRINENFDSIKFLENNKINIYLENIETQKKILVKENIKFQKNNLIFFDEFSIPNDIFIGKYNFIIEFVDNKNQKNLLNLFNIFINKFENINFKSKLILNKDQIFSNEKFNILLETKFYNDTNHELNNKIRINLRPESKYFDLFKGDLFLTDYIFDDLSNYNQETNKQNAENNILFESIYNKNNIFKKDFSFKDYLFPYGRIFVQATIIDKNEKSISKIDSIEYFGSSIFIGVKKDNKNLDNNHFSIIAFDNKKNKIKDQEVYYFIEKKDKKNNWNRIIKNNLKTNSDGLINFSHNNLDSGLYRIIAFAKDNKSKQLSSFDFFIHKKELDLSIKDIANKDYKLDEIGDFEILNKKEIENNNFFQSEDIIKLKISNPFFSISNNIKAFIFIENAFSNILIEKNLNSEFETINIPFDEKLSDGFNVNIVASAIIENNKNVSKNFSDKIILKRNNNKYSELFSIEKKKYKPFEKVEIKINNEILDSEKIECSLVAQNEFLSDINRGLKFEISDQILKRNFIFQNNFYGLFSEIKKLQNIQPRAFASNLYTKNKLNNNEYFVKNNKNIFFIKESFNIDQSKKDQISYTIPENFSGAINNVFICNIKDSNIFFKNEISIHSSKEIEIEDHERDYFLSPGEEINLNLKIINYNLLK